MPDISFTSDTPSEERLPWEGVTLHDLETVEIDAPLDRLTFASYYEISRLYGDATQGAPDGSADHRVWGLLWTVNGMHLRSYDRGEPFGAMATFGDRRSAIPSDLKAVTNILEEASRKTRNFLSKARCADVCWVLDRQRGKTAVTAIAAYVQAVRQVRDKSLSYQFDTSSRAELSHESRDLLRRALWIARVTGWNSEEANQAKSLCVELKEAALRKKDRNATYWFSELDYLQTISGPADLGRSIEQLLLDTPRQSPDHGEINLWRLAAQSYRRAKQEECQNRCYAKVSDCFVTMASTSHSALVAAAHLHDAITALREMPAQRERRQELKHRLVDVQSRISDELKTFSQKVDLTEVVVQTEAALQHLSLKDCLFWLASVAASPDPAALRDEAQEMLSEFPLSSMFGTVHLDHEGKTIHRSQAGGWGKGSDTSVLPPEVALSESHRRFVLVNAAIQPALNFISNHHSFSDQQFASLLNISGFVAENQAATYARGFIRWFNGDYVSSCYILTPLLENSLRHVLKLAGHDVTKVDDRSQTQQDRSISQLFEQMRSELEAIFGAATIGDIENVFLTHPGPYLRHSLCHGLLLDGQPYGADSIYACWLMFRLCLLPLFPYRGEIDLP